MQLCAACQRHIKASPCPFCGESRTRAPLVGLVVSAALVASACARSTAEIYGAPPAPNNDPIPSSPAAPTPTVDTPDAAVPRMSVEIYGAPPAPPNKPPPR